MDYFFLGDSELVTAFRFVGIDGVPVNSAESALDLFQRITGKREETADPALSLAMQKAEKCRVLIMTEEVADWLGDSLIAWQLSNRYPLVVEIPGLMGRLPGRKTLTDSIREAIGISV